MIMIQSINDQFDQFVKKIVERMVGGLVRHKMIAESEREEYFYGMHLIILKGLNWILFLTIICFLPDKLGSFIFLIFLFLLRGQTGGLHASSSLGCALGGGCILIAANYITLLFRKGNFLWAAAGVLVAVVIILLGTPVDHPNLDLSEYEKKMCRKNVKIILSAELTCILLCYFITPGNVILFYECLAVMVCAFFILAGRRKRQ